MSDTYVSGHTFTHHECADVFACPLDVCVPPIFFLAPHGFISVEVVCTA